MIKSEYLNIVSSIFENNGFTKIETPIIENSDIYLRKLGPELAGQLYSFVDPDGNNVTLRPEFTSSVIRQFIENKPTSKSTRYSYEGPIFRHNIESNEKTQAGVEIIGGHDTDYEVIKTAIDGLEGLNFNNINLKIGHIGILSSILDQFEFSDILKLLLVQNINEIKNGTFDEVSFYEEMGNGQENSKILPEATNSTNILNELIEKVMLNYVSGSTGRRTQHEIIFSLMQKWSDLDNKKSFIQALDKLQTVSNISGKPLDVIKSLKETLGDLTQPSAIITSLETTLSQLLNNVQKEINIEVDLGYVRGISYYTGIIFDFSIQGTSVCGGGRYDDLVQILGGPSTPAVGFAYDIESILNLKQHKIG
tara:strand:- start:147 stop:1241 length:1095 start_codon:yes stop_codon:yes gene_type:complete